MVREGSKPSLPLFLARNNDVRKKIIQYGLENLAELTVEKLHSWLHKKVLSALAKKKTEELREQYCVRLKEGETTDENDGLEMLDEKILIR